MILPRLSILAAAVVVGQAAACNASVGNETRGTNDRPAFSDDPTSAGATDTPESHLLDGSVADAGRLFDRAPGDDAGVAPAAALRQPDPSCLKSTSPRAAVKRVELDDSPAPVSNGATVSGLYTIYGDNALSNVRLDFCTPDGPLLDAGGGMNYLGGGGEVTRRWQTKNNVILPVGRVQAQVIADGDPKLKLVYDIEIR